MRNTGPVVEKIVTCLLMNIKTGTDVNRLAKVMDYLFRR